MKGAEFPLLIDVSLTIANAPKTSLGPVSAENEQIYERFMARKAATEARLKQLRDTVKLQVRMNRALRVGRTPGVVVDALNALQQAGLEEHFLTVGTHALYAYETACGVRVQPEATATQDIDLLLDTRKHLRFVTTMQQLDTSLLGIFQTVDKTFSLRPDQRYTAVNAAGFEIEVIRRSAETRAGSDPQTLLDGGRFTQTVVASNGSMATMHAAEPRAFIRVKRSLSERPDRDPLKARKDRLQAEVVQRLWDDEGLQYIVARGSQ